MTMLLLLKVFERLNKLKGNWILGNVFKPCAHGGKQRYIGTRYHINDTYKTMMDRGSVKPRIYPATINGEADGEPVFLEKSRLMEKRRDIGPYTFGTQMLQNPIADKAMSFKRMAKILWNLRRHIKME